MKLFSSFLLMATTGVLAATPNQPSQSVPEAFTGLNYHKAAVSQQAMVSAANPHAVNAGVEMLKLGGNAIDAAIAVQLVLTLVEPQSSGIGGGAFLMWYDAKNKEVSSFDGRETAPSLADENLFIGEDGKPVSWIDAVVGGRSVGVPGILKMMSDVHQQQGRMPWSTLFKPAIDLAEKGFVVSPRLAKLVAMKFNPGMIKLKTIRDYFYPNGVAVKEGSTIINKAYAETLKLIAKQGVSAFYKGDIARQVVDAVNNAEIAPGRLSLKDMAKYTSKQREPVCVDYKGNNGDFDICSMGAPSSGGLTVLQILKLLEPFKLEQHPIDSAETVHLYTQAARLAYADRDKYIADPDFVDVPSKAFLDETYLDQRRSLIFTSKDMGKAKAGELNDKKFAYNHSIAQPNTTHISIVDQFGNGLSMTSSIEMGFGSTVMAGGFILNNQLTDFSRIGSKNGVKIANRVQANKRPRSSMTPVVILKDGQLHALIGSPGGSRIINYVGYALIGLLDYQFDMQEVVNMPRISNRNGVTSLEKGSSVEKLAPLLTQMGHKVKVVNLTSGIHGVLKTNKGWQGAADPRREGTARGL